MSAFLSTQDLKARAYHAGLSTQERRQAFSEFVNDEIDIMVATLVENHWRPFTKDRRPNSE